MIRLVVTLVRLWVRLYTAGLETDVRDRIRQEIAADLWEQLTGVDACGRSTKQALTIFLRLIIGIPADLQRMREEPASTTMPTPVRRIRAAMVTMIVIVENIIFFILGLAAFSLGVGPTEFLRVRPRPWHHSP